MNQYYSVFDDSPKQDKGRKFFHSDDTDFNVVSKKIVEKTSPNHITINRKLFLKDPETLTYNDEIRFLQEEMVLKDNKIHSLTDKCDELYELNSSYLVLGLTVGFILGIFLSPIRK